jgi:CheY-like chemotaxis protein
MQVNLSSTDRFKRVNPYRKNWGKVSGRGSPMSHKIKFDVVPVLEVPTEDVSLTSASQPVVLVVDDEKVIADTLSIILKQSGFSAVTAYEGHTALQLARQFKPDLLISDVMMPGMTGIQLAITMKQTQPQCKILLFSGQAATVDLLEEARSLGHDFTTLTKPVHPTDMLRRISECLSMQEPSFSSANASSQTTAQFVS